MASPRTEHKRSALISILFVHYGQPWVRGSEQCLLDLLAHIDRQRFAPTVVCNQAVLAHEINELGIKVIVAHEAAPAGVIASRQQVRVLQHIARACGAQIIHANTSVTVPALLRVARAARIPLLVHLHITPNASERRHELLHQASMVVGVSQHAVEGFVAEGMPADRVAVVHNAVDGERIARGNATGLRASLGIPVSSFVVATVGSLIKRKAHEVAIMAIGSARAQGVDAHLLVCGDGEEETHLRQLVIDQDLQPYIHFLGFRADVGAILRDATDVLLAPSRMEAMPLNVLEAQWFGLPVIASDIESHREALLAEDPASFVALDDYEGFARALINLHHDKDRQRRAREVTGPMARSYFAINRYVADFQARYTNLVNVPRREYGWLSATRWPAVYSQWLRDIVVRRVAGRQTRRAS